MDILDIFNFLQGCWNIINLLLTAIGNFLVFSFSIVAFHLNFVLYVLRLAFSYIKFVVQVIPPFLLPVFSLIFYIRLIKFMLGRGNSFTRQNSKVVQKGDNPGKGKSGNSNGSASTTKKAPNFDVNSPKVYK